MLKAIGNWIIQAKNYFEKNGSISCTDTIPYFVWLALSALIGLAVFLILRIESTDDLEESLDSRP